MCDDGSMDGSIDQSIDHSFVCSFVRSLYLFVRSVHLSPISARLVESPDRVNGESESENEEEEEFE